MSVLCVVQKPLIKINFRNVKYPRQLWYVQRKGFYAEDLTLAHTNAHRYTVFFAP